MSVEEATLAEMVAHLKILRLAGLTEVRRSTLGPSDAEAPEEESLLSAATPVEARVGPVLAPQSRIEHSSPERSSGEQPALRTVASPQPVRPSGDGAESWSAPLSREERIPALSLAAEEVAACIRCGELARTRKQTVFGVGDPMARLALLGEAPGEEEDKRGEPFVGRAGQLLDRMIAACSLRREDVYILNVLKCRPPGNRNPLPTEATACRPFLDRQLEIVQPEFILCLGAVAAKNLLGVELAVGKMRGKLFRYRGAKVVVTYHPSYLLRTEAAKRDAWEDLKFLLREMGIDPAKRKPEG